jgi:hypothetical protein
MQAIKVGDTLFRIEDARACEDYPPTYTVMEFEVISETAKTFMLRRVNGFHKRRMLKNAHRPFAFSTKEEAAYSYARRKFRHIEHALRNYNRALILFANVKKEYNIEWF